MKKYGAVRAQRKPSTTTALCAAGIEGSAAYNQTKVMVVARVADRSEAEAPTPSGRTFSCD